MGGGVGKRSRSLLERSLSLAIESVPEKEQLYMLEDALRAPHDGFLRKEVVQLVTAIIKDQGPSQASAVRVTRQGRRASK